MNTNTENTGIIESGESAPSELSGGFKKLFKSFQDEKDEIAKNQETGINKSPAGSALDANQLAEGKKLAKLTEGNLQGLEKIIPGIKENDKAETKGMALGKDFGQKQGSGQSFSTVKGMAKSPVSMAHSVNEGNVTKLVQEIADKAVKVVAMIANALGPVGKAIGKALEVGKQAFNKTIGKAEELTKMGVEGFDEQKHMEAQFNPSKGLEGAIKRTPFVGEKVAAQFGLINNPETGNDVPGQGRPTDKPSQASKPTQPPPGSPPSRV